MTGSFSACSFARIFPLRLKSMLERLGDEDIIRAFDFLENHGDRISQVGAIEVGLRILPERPAIQSILIRLIEQIRDDNVEDAASGFKVFSALFGLVDGELSRTRLLSAEPPFYRRLVSLAQAALIHRQYVNAGISDGAFCEWALKARGGAYFLQTLTDLRLEPRWTPNLASAPQMQAEFFGRIMITASNHEDGIKGSELHPLLLGDGPKSLRSRSEFLNPFFPGPLEGGGSSPNPLPTQYAEAISAQLSTEKAEVPSFVALVNAGQIFRVQSQQAGISGEATEYERLSNFRPGRQGATPLCPGWFGYGCRRDQKSHACRRIANCCTPVRERCPI